MAITSRAAWVIAVSLITGAVLTPGTAAEAAEKAAKGKPAGPKMNPSPNMAPDLSNLVGNLSTEKVGGELLVPRKGLEPPTPALRKRCSTN